VRELVVVALLTGLATGLGVVPFLFVENIPRRIYDTVLGLGAGLMLSAATIGLLSSAMDWVRVPGRPLDVLNLVLVVAGFLCGAGAVILMERAIPHVHAGGHHEHLHDVEDGDAGGSAQGGHVHSPLEPGHAHDSDHAASTARARKHGYLLTGAMAIHRIPEGFAIGAGFATQASHPLGVVLAVAVAAQNVCEGALMGAPLRHGGMRTGRALATVEATGLTIPLAAIAGYSLAHTVARALPFSLALAAGALIYLVSSEIIPETHSHGNEGSATAGVIAGFLLTVLLQILVGRDI
jgi:ZIP family zinc transporter